MYTATPYLRRGNVLQAEWGRDGNDFVCLFRVSLSIPPSMPHADGVAVTLLVLLWNSEHDTRVGCPSTVIPSPNHRNSERFVTVQRGVSDRGGYVSRHHRLTLGGFSIVRLGSGQLMVPCSCASEAGASRDQRKAEAKISDLSSIR